MSKIDSFLNPSPLKTTVSRKVTSFSDISAVNLMVGWNLWSRPQRLVTALYFLVFFFFRSLDVHVGKKAKETSYLSFATQASKTKQKFFFC